jgi:TolB-like protein
VWRLLFALLFALPAHADPQRLIVLELYNPAQVPDQEVRYLGELVRAEAAALPRDRWFVLTRENILETLPPGAAYEACDGGCEVETGRRVGADFIVSGDVVRVAGTLRVALRLHETRSAALLASETASGADVPGVEVPLRDAAARLLTRLPGALPAAPAPPVATASSDLHWPSFGLMATGAMVGVAGLAAWGKFHFDATAARQDLDSCEFWEGDPFACSDAKIARLERDEDDADDSARAAIFVAGVGGAAMLAGFVWMMSELTGPSVGVAPTPNGLSAFGTF